MSSGANAAVRSGSGRASGSSSEDLSVLLNELRSKAPEKLKLFLEQESSLEAEIASLTAKLSTIRNDRRQIERLVNKMNPGDKSPSETMQAAAKSLAAAMTRGQTYSHKELGGLTDAKSPQQVISAALHGKLIERKERGKYTLV